MFSIAQKNHRSAAMKLAATVAVAFSLIAIVTAQRVDVEPTQLEVLENAEASILCRFGKPLQYCRVEVPGEPSAMNLSPQWDRNPTFKYFGAGMNEGQCGVTIRRVRAQNNGVVKCYMGTSDGDEVIGQVPLTVALPPQRPELQILSGNKQGIFEVEQQVKLRCIARDGRPAAKLTWFLDAEPITAGLNSEQPTESLASNNQTLYTSTQTLSRTVLPTDDGRKITCRASAAGKELDTVLQMQVKFRPIYQPEIRVFGVVQGLTALVNVSIMANPRPRTEWTVDGLVISEGGQNGRFEAYEPVEQGNSVYNVTLAIAALTLEDTTKEYVLRASNQFGMTEYVVRISSSEAAVPTGLDVGSIVGIAVGVAVLVLIVALVVVARLTGKWCFAGATLNTDIGPDSEAQITAPHDYEGGAHDDDDDDNAGHDHHAATVAAQQTDINEKAAAPASAENGNGNGKEKTHSAV